MAEGEDKTLKQLIDQINQNPLYKVVTTEEYDALMKIKATGTIPEQEPLFSTPDKKGNPGLKLDFSKIGHKGHQGQGAQGQGAQGQGAQGQQGQGSFNQSSLDLSAMSQYMNPPKLPIFNGSEEPKKDDISFDVWCFEVKCMQKTNIPENIILQSIRSSLRGAARGVLVSLGSSATVDILDKFEGFYGNVSSSETLMQTFYNDCQKEGESIVQYGLRLERTLTKAVKLGHIDSDAQDSILRSKFWTGLKSQQLRNATRHKYDTVWDFQSLLREIRKVDQEEQNMVGSKSTNKPKSAQSQTQSASSDSDKFSNESIYKQLCELKSQLKTLQNKMESGKGVESTHQPQQYPGSRGFGRGTGNYRGRGSARRGQGRRPFPRGQRGGYGGQNVENQGTGGNDPNA